MARLTLVGGAYSTRSPISSTQKCINLFPEKNRSDGPQTMTHYQRAGRRALSRPPTAGPGRGVFRLSNGVGISVAGLSVYLIGTDWSQTQIGTLLVPESVPSAVSDNGTQAFMVDGSPVGYTWNIADGSGFSQIIDPSGTFTGGTHVGYIDTFLLWNIVGTRLFGSTLSNEIAFDPTFVAAKTAYPDLLQSIYINRHNIILLGLEKSEFWYDAGGVLFPFASLPGAFVEWGIQAPRSIASSDISCFWLAQSAVGAGLVVRQRGYDTKVISNYALSYAIQQLTRNGFDISDAIGYTFTRDGHVFYCLTFVSGNQTWVFDDSIGDPDLAWHQEGFTDRNGQLNRMRDTSQAFINGRNVTQDWQNGTLYEIDPDYYFDDVDEGDGQGQWAHPISCTRTFPQILLSVGPDGQPKYLDAQTVRLNNFIADIQNGDVANDLVGATYTPKVGLRVSWDRGKTFGDFVLQELGRTGEYGTTQKWGPLGIGRWPVLELNYSIPGATALNGGWISGMGLNV